MPFPALRRAALLGLGLLTLAVPRDARGWNRAGHMVSGAIAYHELRATDPAALQRIIRMLAAHPEYQARWLPLIRARGMADHDVMLFMYAARWADDVRGEARYDHPNWHYTNVPFVPPGDSTRPPSVTEGDIIVESYHQFSVMRDPEAPDVQKAEALAWLFHLVGDVHQPLHATNLYSSRWPQGDRGGNLFYIRATPTSQPINLHSFWDGLIIGSDDVRATMNRAIALRAAHPATSVAMQLVQLEPRSWAVDESVPLSRRWAYLGGALAGGTSRETAAVLPASYAADAQRVAEERVTLAGYRLAAVAARLVGEPRTGSADVPFALVGEFVDDYENRFTITPTEWRQRPGARYHIVRWDTTAHYLIAQNDSANSSAAGKWTRIDWVRLDGMAPWEWAFCLSAYDAPTAAAAAAVTIARPQAPRTGCNGFPFSRMQRAKPVPPPSPHATARRSPAAFGIEQRP